MFEVTFIIAIEPRFMIFGNAAGMFLVWGGVFIGIIVGRFQGGGYRVWCRQFNDLIVGLPQYRNIPCIRTIQGIEIEKEIQWPIPIDPFFLKDFLVPAFRDPARYLGNRFAAPRPCIFLLWPYGAALSMIGLWPGISRGIINPTRCPVYIVLPPSTARRTGIGVETAADMSRGAMPQGSKDCVHMVRFGPLLMQTFLG